MKSRQNTRFPAEKNFEKFSRKPSTRIKRIKRGLVFIIVWTLFVLFLLLAPIQETLILTPLGFNNFDKVVHFFLFAISGLINVLGSAFLGNFKTRVLFGIIAGLFLAIGTEFIQSFIYTRSMSLYDLLADIAGLTIAIILCLLFYRKSIFIRFLAI